MLKKYKKKVISSMIHNRIRKEGIKGISFWFKNKYGKFYSEVELNKILFSSIKADYPHEAAKIGNKIYAVEKDPKFMKILAKVHKDIGNIEQYKSLVYEIIKLSPEQHANAPFLVLGDHKELSIVKFKKNLIELSDTTETSQKEIQEFLDQYRAEFDDNSIINKLVFSVLKDSHTELAINYGIEYYNSQRKPIDIRFAKVLLLRLERLTLFEKAKLLAVDMLKNVPSSSFYEEKIVLYISIEDGQEILSQGDNIEAYTKKLLSNLLGKENLKLDLLVYKIIFTIAKNKENQKLAKYYADKYFTISDGDNLLQKLLEKNTFTTKGAKEKIYTTSPETFIEKIFRLVFGGRKCSLLIKKMMNKYSFDNTYMNISQYIPKIVNLLSKDQVKVAYGFFANDNDLDGLLYIYNHVNWRHNNMLNVKNLFFRLIDMIKYSKINISLPEQVIFPEKYKPRDYRNVLYVVHMRAPIINNGYTRRTSLIIEMLHMQKYNIIGVTRLAFPNEFAKYRYRKILINELVDDTNFYTLPDPLGGLNRRAVSKYINAYANRLVDIAKKERAEIIHSSSNYLNGLASIIASRKLGIPCIYEVRGLWYLTKMTTNNKYSESIKYAMEEKMELQAVKEADKVIVISESLKKYFIDRGIEQDKINFVPNAVNTNMFDPEKEITSLPTKIKFPKNTIVIGYIGSFVEYEGLDILVHAVNKLKQRGYTNFRVLLVGTGNIAEHIKKLVNDYKITELFYFIGQISPQDVLNYYFQIDIAPFPRKKYLITELVPPLKIMEAMAMECAVIYSNLAALKENCINEETGMEVEANNIDMLADVLEYLFKNPEKAKIMGKQARQWVIDNRSIDTVQHNLKKAYVL